MNRIYLDYMATTPVAPEVVSVMKRYLGLEGCFGNPASNTHEFGLQARRAVEGAREQVASLIGAKPHEVIWTSGATESNNLAIKGVFDFYHEQKNHIVTVATEHKAVLDTCQYLEKRGCEVTYIQPDTKGLVSVSKVEAALRPNTLLVSMMHVNNEIGVVHDIEKIGDMLKRFGVLFHVDAAQSAGKLPIELSKLSVDLMSFSGHKIYGPKGIGALYVRSKPRVRLTPLIHGGGHESGLRSGTLATHQIVGMGEAFALAERQLMSDHARLQRYFDRFVEAITKLPGVVLNGSRHNRYPGNINFRVAGINGEALVMALCPIAVSTSSACASSRRTPSYVLKAIGLSDKEALASVRLSLGRYTTDADMDAVEKHVVAQIKNLQAISPEWHNHAIFTAG